MSGTRSAEPTAVEIDGALEGGRAHTGIGNRQYAAAGNAPDGKQALIYVGPISEMSDYGIQVLNGSLEARDRNLGIAGITRAVRS